MSPFSRHVCLLSVGVVGAEVSKELRERRERLQRTTMERENSEKHICKGKATG